MRIDFSEKKLIFYIFIVSCIDTKQKKSVYYTHKAGTRACKEYNMNTTENKWFVKNGYQN